MDKKKSVSPTELASHTGLDGVYWTAINGKVYDFTNFVDVHPGGSKIIRLAAGRYDSSFLGANFQEIQPFFLRATILKSPSVL
jgi:cytochrome b involved in lipid metabolism